MATTSTAEGPDVETAGNESHLENGMEELKRLFLSTWGMGPVTTAKREVSRDRAYVRRGGSTLKKVMRAGQSGTQLVGVMLTIVVAAAVGFVGTKVTSEMDDSIDTTDGTKYDNASDSIAQGFADAMGLTDIVFLVLIFGVILGALLAFRGGR